METYRQAFDEEFDRHERTVSTRLADTLAVLSRHRSDPLRVVMGHNSAALAEFPELIEKPAFEEIRGRVREIEADIKTLLAQWDKKYRLAFETVRMACERKRQAPHNPLPIIDMAEIGDMEAVLAEKVGRYNEALAISTAQLLEFKQSSNPAAIQERIDAVATAESDAALSLARISLNDQCVRHREITMRMEILDREIPILQMQLRDDQSSYLQSFFDSLNNWFKKFGSLDFTLERAEDAHGHTPVYFLRVKYHDVEINEHDLEKVFSESDRRALALAVFWTQLQELPDDEKAKQIVVLDDPLTSFDDGRVTAVHSELVSALDGVQQIIVLSHYSHEIRCFLEKYKYLDGLRLLSLETRSDGTHLVASDPEEFIRSEHEKTRLELSAFAGGIENVCEFGALRVFFEQELSSRFAAQIAANNIGVAQIAEKIDGLAASSAISDVTARKCHEWRTILNPAHHIWPSNDLEDRRNTTRALLNFIYREMVPR